MEAAPEKYLVTALISVAMSDREQRRKPCSIPEIRCKSFCQSVKGGAVVSLPSARPRITLQMVLIALPRRSKLLNNQTTVFKPQEKRHLGYRRNHQIRDMRVESGACVCQ